MRRWLWISALTFIVSFLILFKNISYLSILISHRVFDQIDVKLRPKHKKATVRKVGDEGYHNLQNYLKDTNDH
jgi:ankyrin repeat protein